jgi:hypothetical protein
VDLEVAEARVPMRSPGWQPSRAKACAAWRERRATSRQLLRCRSPSTRLLTISVSPECRSACFSNDEISSGSDIIRPINAMLVSWRFYQSSLVFG